MPSSGIASPEAATTRRGAWLILGVLSLGYVINYVDRQVIFSIFPALRAEMGLTNAQFGLIGSMFIWVYSVCNPLAGRAADVMRREVLVLASLLLWSLATLGTALSASFGGLLLWRAVMGVTEALYVPASLSIIGSVHGSATRSRALAVWSTGQMTGIIGGGWYGGWTADQWGWRTGFAVLAGIGVLFAPGLWFAVRGVPRAARSTAAPARPAEVLRSRCYLGLGAAFFMLCIMLWMLYAWLPDFVHERFHLSMADSGLTATLYLQTSTMAGILSGGALADWLVRRVPAGRYYIASAGLLLAAPFAWLTLGSPSAGVLRLASAAFGLFAGFIIANIFAAAYDVVAAENYGIAAGAINMVGGISGGFAIFLAGRWKESVGIHTLMGWSAVAAALSALVLAAVAAREFARDRRRAGILISQGYALK